MRKIIFHSAGNTILFLLFGLAFLFPFAEIQQSGTTGFSGKMTVFPLLLLGYFIIYPIVNYIFNRVLKLDKRDHSELSFSDEREKVIVAEAAKVAYKILIGGLLITVAALGGIRTFSLFTREEISIYFVSVLLIMVLLIVTTIAYCITWCLAYRK